MPRAKRQKAAPPAATPVSPAAQKLAERVTRILNHRWAWTYLVMGWEKDGEGFDYPQVMQPLSKLLETEWQRAVKYLGGWIEAAANDPKTSNELTELFRHPDAYPDVVLWVGLCTLKFDPKQCEITRQFLGERIFKRIRVPLGGADVLQKHLGLTVQRDYTSKHVRGFKPITDLESELYLHFAESVLKDTTKVTSNVLGYLYTAAKNRLNDIYRQTKAESRPALEQPSVTQADLEEDTLESEESALSRQKYDELTAEAGAQFEAVEATEAAELQLARKAQLPAKQLQLLVLLAEDPDMPHKEIARRLKVSAPAVTQMLERIRDNPILRQLASRQGHRLAS